MFSFYIDPGRATPEEIAELLEAIIDLHEAEGGEPLTFTVDGIGKADGPQPPPSPTGAVDVPKR